MLAVIWLAATVVLCVMGAWFSIVAGNASSALSVVVALVAGALAIGAGVHRVVRQRPTVPYGVVIVGLIALIIALIAVHTEQVSSAEAAGVFAGYLALYVLAVELRAAELRRRTS